MMFLSRNKIRPFLTCIMIVILLCSIQTTFASFEIKKNESISMNQAMMLPETFDWRNVEGVDWTTSIKDQLQDLCGSCWAFGALGGLESAVKLWNNNPTLDVDLSEQYLLSCSGGGCDGWYLSWALRWIEKNGMISESCFPYQANDTIPCEAKCENWNDELFGLTDYKKVSSDVVSIQTALFEYGPLPATMTVYDDFYPDFDGGVYQQNSDTIVFGHCITIVGYDDTWGSEDEGYWICKNSWGTEWGEEGWFRIAYGECEIEKGVYYLEGPNYPPLKPDVPSGEINGESGIEYEYSTSTYDVENNEISFLFDWGDEKSSDWIGPFNSNESVTVSHTWVEKGTYQVRVKAKDSYGLETAWSNPLEVSMPKVKSFNFYSWLIQKIPFIKQLIFINY